MYPYSFAGNRPLDSRVIKAERSIKQTLVLTATTPGREAFKFVLIRYRKFYQEMSALLAEGGLVNTPNCKGCKTTNVVDILFKSIPHNKFQGASIVERNFHQCSVQIVRTVHQHAPIHIISSLVLSFSRPLMDRLHGGLISKLWILLARFGNSGNVAVAEVLQSEPFAPFGVLKG
jgi:hypothetical protein